ncbi:B12-binding domain-containing protein [Acetonema longum]|uniref:Cobalamin B12-binding protein n=1 Tax=Acetonema longum DSM 6540 TaxID=1009370 RepID=F7NE89_9FIRM|nr:B12-binding domain-containing protein [Acetonema longum]EGO65601.1 cobalamin B12-binding protein [Acetonema longum DSM 6540]
MLPLLADALQELNEPLAIDLVRKALNQGVSPLDIVEECRTGLVEVGDRYARGEYFLGDLILSSEIFTQIMNLLTPVLESGECRPTIGKIVFGTVEGDIHDIGKNLAISMVKCYGFEVYDVGVDVSPDKFILALAESGARILCLCTLLSPGFEALKRTIQLVRLIERDTKIKILIGGLVSEKVREYTGADAWIDDARQGVDVCLKWNEELGDR